jgi:hypothetical protein
MDMVRKIAHDRRAERAWGSGPSDAARVPHHALRSSSEVASLLNTRTGRDALVVVSG